MNDHSFQDVRKRLQHFVVIARRILRSHSKSMCALKGEGYLKTKKAYEKVQKGRGRLKERMYAHVILIP